MKTTVVHLKVHEYDVRIDRQTRWGNPFSHQERTVAQTHVGSREEAISRHKAWLWEQIKDGTISLNDLAELHGKVLGCWCVPRLCHGATLANAADWAYGVIAKVRIENAR